MAKQWQNDGKYFSSSKIYPVRVGSGRKEPQHRMIVPHYRNTFYFSVILRYAILSGTLSGYGSPARLWVEADVAPVDFRIFFQKFSVPLSLFTRISFQLFDASMEDLVNHLLTQFSIKLIRDPGI